MNPISNESIIVKNIFFSTFSGDATVLWKKNPDSHLFVGNQKIQMHQRMELKDGTSLLIESASLEYAGQLIEVLKNLN